MSYTEQEKQEQSTIDEIVRGIVHKRVYAEISNAVEYFKKHDEDTFAEIIGEAICKTPYSEDEIMQAVKASLDEDQLDEILVSLYEESPELQGEHGDLEDLSVGQKYNLIEMHADLDEIVDTFSLEIERDGIEIYQYWLVEGTLADLLKEQGEIVIELPIFSQDVWCRTTCGQALYADGCFQAIARARYLKYGA